MILWCLNGPQILNQLGQLPGNGTAQKGGDGVSNALWLERLQLRPRGGKNWLGRFQMWKDVQIVNKNSGSAPKCDLKKNNYCIFVVSVWLIWKIFLLFQKMDPCHQQTQAAQVRFMYFSAEDVLVKVLGQWHLNRKKTVEGMDPHRLEVWLLISRFQFCYFKSLGQ